MGTPDRRAKGTPLQGTTASARRAELVWVAAQLGVQAYSSLENCLADMRVELIINLANPYSHYSVSASLIAGKHVYSEKPLAFGSIMQKSWCDWRMGRG